MNHKYDELEELFERVENIEKQIKEDKEEQLKKLEAELACAKFRCNSDFYEGFILNNFYRLKEKVRNK